MEDQNNELGQPNPETTPVMQLAAPRRMSPVVPLVVLVLIGLVVWAVVGRKQAFDAASYFPKEVAFAAIVDLSPNSEKDAGRDFIMGVLKDGGITDPQKQAFEALSKQLNIDVERDVVPHLNGKGGLAIGTDMAGMAPPLTLVLGTKSDGAAGKLVDVVKAKLKEANIGFTPLKYEGCEYLQIQVQMAYVCVGAVGNGLVATAGEETFKKVVDSHKGKPSLVDNEYYAKFKSSENSTFATVFYSGPGFYKLIGPYLSMAAAQMGPGMAEQIKKGYESAQAVVCNAQVNGDGIRALTNAVSTQKSPAIAQSSVKQLVAKIPADAAFVMSWDQIDKMWAEAKKQLQSTPGGMASIEPIIAQVQQTLGIDPIKDVVDHLKSMSAYYLPKAPLKPDGFPGDIAITLKVDRPEAIAAAMSKVHNAVLTLTGAPAKASLVSGQKIVTVGLGKPGMELVDALVGDQLVVVITGRRSADAAKSAMDVLQGKGDGLAKSKRFKAVSSKLWDKSSGFIYGDVGQVIRVIQKEITPDKDRRAALAVADKVGPFGMVNRMDGKEGESLFYAPFLQ